MSKMFALSPPQKTKYKITPSTPGTPILPLATEDFGEFDRSIFDHIDSWDLDVIIEQLHRDPGLATTANVDGITPLMSAIENIAFDGIFEIFTTLLAYYSPAQLNMQNNEGETALHVAAQHNLPGVIDSLIEHGIDISLTDIDGNTALHIAIDEANYNEISILLENNAEMPANIIFEGEMPFLVRAIIDNQPADFIQDLINHNQDVNLTDAQGRSAILYAAHAGREDIVSVLHDNGALVPAGSPPRLVSIIEDIIHVEEALDSVVDDLVAATLSASEIASDTAMLGAASGSDFDASDLT